MPASESVRLKEFEYVTISVASMARSSSSKVCNTANSSSNLKKILSSNLIDNIRLKRLIASCAGISPFLKPQNLRYSSISCSFLAKTVSNCHPSSRCKISALKSASFECGGRPTRLYKQWRILSIGVKSMTCSIIEKEILDHDRGVKLVKSWIVQVFVDGNISFCCVMLKPAQSALISLSLFCRIVQIKSESL